MRVFILPSHPPEGSMMMPPLPNLCQLKVSLLSDEFKHKPTRLLQASSFI